MRSINLRFRVPSVRAGLAIVGDAQTGHIGGVEVDLITGRFGDPVVLFHHNDVSELE
jgi:hypothetical protein